MWSGVERYSLDICRHCLAKGDDVIAVTRDARAVDDVFRHHGIPVTFAPLGGFLSYGAVKSICAVLSADSGPTVVHCHDTRDAFSVLTARSLLGRHDVRVILTRHYVRRAGRSPFHKYVYRNVDDLVFVSKISGDRFFSTWHGRDKERSEINSHVIHNSLNIDLKPVVDEPRKGPVTATYLGRLAPHKGLEYLIRALSMLKDLKIRLRLVGSGHPDYVDSLRRKASEAGVMHMIDWPRHQENAVDFIRLSHFGVLPSTAPEAFGLSNIEYMSEGRPLICTGNGAQPEYITNGREGILVPPRDVTTLAAEMRRLATSPELRQRIGMAARERFEKELSWPHFIGRLYPLYEARQ